MRIFTFAPNQNIIYENKKYINFIINAFRYVINDFMWIYKGLHGSLRCGFNIC